MENNYKTIVYLTVNTVNDKIYVGVHTTENPNKFDGYIGNGINIYHPSTNSHPKTPFQYAVKKYGFRSFKRYVLYVFDTREEALDQERKIVNENFIIRDDTYNITIGGGDPPIYEKKVYQYSIDGEFINEYLNIISAEKEIGLKSGISSAIKYKTICGGFLWSDEKFDKLCLDDYKIVVQKVKIYSYDANGLYVKEYESISDFCRENKVGLSPVQRAIKDKTKIKGYYISTEKNIKFTFKNKKEKKAIKIHQYDLNGNYIKSFDSCLSASKELGKGYSQIYKNVKLGNCICGNYQWSVEKVNKMPKREIYISARKVGQYDLNGNLIKVFNTVRECRKEFGNVSRVLSGKCAKCKGYTFKYM